MNHEWKSANPPMSGRPLRTPVTLKPGHRQTALLALQLKNSPTFRLKLTICPAQPVVSFVVHEHVQPIPG